MQIDPTGPCSELQRSLRGAAAQRLSELAALGVAPADRGARQQRWSELERDILRWLRAEEELLLPQFELSAPVEAALIRQGHQRIRAQLAELSRELQEERCEPARLAELARSLRSTSRDEERSLYGWADACLRPARKGELIARLRAAPRAGAA